MTKKEIIIKAWLDLGIKTPFGICDNTGYYHGYFCNGVDDIEAEYGAEITDLINYDIDSYGVGKFRPKSLEGIENNNGWIKIESVEDLPELKDELLIFRNKEGFTTTWQSDDIKSTPNYFLRYSYWRLKDKILDPLF